MKYYKPILNILKNHNNSTCELQPIQYSSQSTNPRKHPNRQTPHTLELINIPQKTHKSPAKSHRHKKNKNNEVLYHYQGISLK